MNPISSIKHFLSTLVVCFFLFIAFGTSEEEKQSSNNTSNPTEDQAQTFERTAPPATDETPSAPTENKNSNLINDGSYEGNSICTCCGSSANKPGNDYTIEVKNISENKISFYNLEYRQREIIGNIENGKIIIDERNSQIVGLVFWGTVEIVDKNTIKIDIEWTDTSGPYNGEALNHCIGTYKNTTN